MGDDACPFTALYWTFLERNQARLAGNQRMRLPLASLARKPAAERAALRARAARARDDLLAAPYERPS